MFDMGFTELMLIGIVALVVIGPERLPGVARTAGKYVGRLKRFMTTVKADVEQELRADELRQILSDQQKELDTLKDSISEAGRSVEKEFGPDDVRISEAAPETTAVAPDVIQETPLPDSVSDESVAKAPADKSAASKPVSKKAALKKPAPNKAGAKKSSVTRSPAKKKSTAKKAAPKKTASIESGSKPAP